MAPCHHGPESRITAKLPPPPVDIPPHLEGVIRVEGYVLLEQGDRALVIAHLGSHNGFIPYQFLLGIDLAISPGPDQDMLGTVCEALLCSPGGSPLTRSPDHPTHDELRQVGLEASLHRRCQRIHPPCEPPGFG